MNILKLSMVCGWVLLGLVANANATITFSDDFSGGLAANWTTNSWSDYSAYQCAQYTGGAANGWQYIEHSFGGTSESWQFDFDYDWKWGNDSAFRIGADVTDDWNSGYRLLVHEAGANSYELYKVTNGDPNSMGYLAAGDGYSQAGCGNGTPNFKTVRLTWDATTGTLQAFKEIDGQFQQVLSITDPSYNWFSKVRFVVYYTSGETPLVDNVHFANVPEPATLGLLFLGGLLIRRKK